MEGTKLPVPTVLHFFVLLSHFVHAFSYRYRSTHSSGVLQDSHLHRPSLRSGFLRVANLPAHR